MLIKQNSREAVSGKINLSQETWGSEQCKRWTHQLLVMTWLGPLCWAGALSPSALSVDHSQLHFCPEKPLLRWELMHLPLLQGNLQLMTAWYGSSHWWCPAQFIPSCKSCCRAVSGIRMKLGLSWSPIFAKLLILTLPCLVLLTPLSISPETPQESLFFLLLGKSA